MRLDDPNLRLGETELERQQRLTKAAKYQKLATESRTLANRSSLAVRMLRLIAITAVGAVLTISAVYQLTQPLTDAHDSALTRAFGPYGDIIGALVLGLLLTCSAGYFLLKTIRSVQAANARDRR